MKIQCANEEIDLLPERAFFWAKEKLLGFSDVHIGKAESLQGFGIPLPAGTHREDLKKITDLIRTTGAQQVFILGDWIHARNSWTADIHQDLEKFFLQHQQVRWNLLLGNHDRGSAKKLARLPLIVLPDETPHGPFVFSHGHTAQGSRNKSLFCIQGHHHPVVQIREGAMKLRLPCFVVEKNQMTLPSFGNLTGGHPILRQNGRRIFATTGKILFEVP